MNKAAIIFSFVAGAAIGGAATWFYAKKRYEKIAQEEIDSVKESLKRVYSQNNDGPDEETESAEDDEADSERVHPQTFSGYVSQVKDSGYSDEDDEYEPANTPKKNKKPYVISPEEFSYDDEYTKVELSYFADKVLADDNDEVIHDIEDLVGYDSLTHFGEYEDDSVFVRNERLKCDYAILLVEETYATFLERHPYKAEV